MRRLSVAQPIALARAAFTVAIFAALVAGIAAALLHFHVVAVPEGLAALVSGVAVALVAALLAIAAFVRIWRYGEPGFGRAMLAFLVALALLVPAAQLAARALTAPPIWDITTDFDDPPPLAAPATERPPGTHPVTYDPRMAPLQRAAYPAIAPLLVDLAQEDVHKLVLSLVKERRWRLVTDSAPEDSEGPAKDVTILIAAVATTPVLAIPDDVVIRLSEAGGHIRVDMRSASRYGATDFGINAARITSFLEDLRSRALIPPQAVQ